MPKIHIIGGPGSGKTTLANKLSKELGIEHYDLDELQWDNSSDHYGVRRDPDERAKLLDEILQNENWIIEGVYYAWCEKCFVDADKIYLLHVPRRIWRRRIIHRFFRRKLGLEKGKRETLKSLFALLKWADRFETKNLPEIQKILEGYPEKVVKE